MRNETHIKTHLFLNVFKRGGIHNREANEKHVCLRIRKRPKPIIILLSGGIEESDKQYNKKSN